MHHVGRRALVTGGAGFIGSHLVDSLMADGWTVTVVDNFDDFYPRAEKEANVASHLANRRFRLVECDLREPDRMWSVLDGAFDVVIHLGAKAGVRPSLETPLEYQDVNVRGTHVLLECCRRWGVRQFVFASSSSVYGINDRTPWREDDHVLLPISPYASTKVSGELLGHVYSHLYGIRFIALRLFTVYGPRQRPDLAIRKFAKAMLSAQPIVLYGSGGTSRDYTYVADIVSGIRSAMEYSGSDYEIINLGNHEPIGLDALVAQLERGLGTKALIQRTSAQPGDVPRTFADITKARTLLGYAPRTSLSRGIDNFVAWLTTAHAERAYS